MIAQESEKHLFPLWSRGEKSQLYYCSLCGRWWTRQPSKERKKALLPVIFIGSSVPVELYTLTLDVPDTPYNHSVPIWY